MGGRGHNVTVTHGGETARGTCSLRADVEGDFTSPSRESAVQPPDFQRAEPITSRRGACEASEETYGKRTLIPVCTRRPRRTRDGVKDDFALRGPESLLLPNGMREATHDAEIRVPRTQRTEDATWIQRGHFMQRPLRAPECGAGLG